MYNNKTPICRFYQKGYCRYGRSCKFRHPGEENEDVGPTDYSFKTGFSFTRALESTLGKTADIDMSDTPSTSIFSQAYQQLKQQQHQPTPLNSSFSPFSFQQQYRQTQEQPSTGGIFSPFSFQQRDQQLLQQQSFQQQQQQQLYQQIPLHQTVGGFPSFASQPQSAHNHQLFQNKAPQYQQNNLADRQQEQENTQSQQDLSEAELKAFQSDRFEFRKIPVHPPPPTLC